MFLCRLGLDYDALKVLDFGLVKWVGSDETQLTSENMLTGTPSAMPPEQDPGRPGTSARISIRLGAPHTGC